MSLFSSGQGKPIPRRSASRGATRRVGRVRSATLAGLGLALLAVGGVFAPELLGRDAERGWAGREAQPDSDGAGGGQVSSSTAEATPSAAASPTPGVRTPSGPEEKPERSEAPRKKATVPTEGKGKFHTADLERRPASDRGRTITVQVLVEKDLPFEPEKTAGAIAGVLDDERSWVGGGQVRFRFVGGDADPDLKILVATPTTTDRYCRPLRTGGSLSCQVEDRVVLNGTRWAKGIKDYSGDLANYRRYLVNHEVGHFLGYGHVPCPQPGAKAPVMMQQTKGLKGCKPNPWPTGER